MNTDKLVINWQKFA